jgi:hypothetical protein
VAAVPVPLGVPGVPVVDASGVVVDGISAGTDKPGRVGGRVEVTKMGTVGNGVSSETFMQEPRLRLKMESNIQVFFITGILLCEYYRVPHNLLNNRFEFQQANL